MMPDGTLFLYKVWPLALSFPYFKKRIQHHSMKGVIDIQRLWRKRKIKTQGIRYLVVHDPWTSNYYHWMTQALPRLLLAQSQNLPFVLLLPANHCSEFHVKSLLIFNIKNWVPLETDRTYFEVHDLIFPSHDIQIGDYHDDLIQELAARLRPINPPESECSYLFIHRGSKSSRNIINEDEVLNVFLSWGFSVVSFENLTFEEQRAMAGNATILAGVHGAGLTNMLFMDKGAKVLELTSVLNGNQYYYYTLSNALGHDYFYQECTPEIEGKSIQEANILVDLELLNSNISRMVNPVHD
ncbi:MAG: glycosyltransferase family 61 protein [Cyclobacteriaceae bacterium]|nr:glycosyltransferase family 61 protein [Cyclobacteriaceae bacterium]MDH5248134.1 glycosyltransferase family 61 protein [Cyclobacteriaceae bacterium]